MWIECCLRLNLWPVKRGNKYFYDFSLHCSFLLEVKYYVVNIMAFKKIRLLKNVYIPNYISSVFNTTITTNTIYSFTLFVCNSNIVVKSTHIHAHGETNADGVNFYYLCNLPSPALSCTIVSLLVKRSDCAIHFNFGHNRVSEVKCYIFKKI